MKHALHHRRIGTFGLAALMAPLGATFACQPGVAAPAAQATPRAYCARVGDDDSLRRPPRSLAHAIDRLFDIKGGHGLATTYYRCADGAVLLCNVGANLPCGKANAEKSLPAATQWCESHANSDFIPMTVTGHDTLYSWRCVGGKAAAGATIGKRDARGFFAEYWKKL